METMSPGLRSRYSVYPVLGERSWTWANSTTRAGANRARMRSSRAGSNRVEPGSTSGRIMVGGCATATESCSPLRIPKAAATSSGTSSV